MANITMQPCSKSSQIKEWGYDEESATLAIRFGSGTLYHYTGVPKDIADDFAKCDSFGRFHASKIKGNFEYERIDETKKDEAPAESNHLPERTP